jgi:hypothetical protein
MGLDVYVGSLTRYYTHDWETIVQRIGREQGIPVVMKRLNESPDAITDPATIRDLILTWRPLMTRSLHEAGLIDGELDWSEEAETPYFTDKPGWDCYGAVQLLGAHEEEGKPLLGSAYPSKLRNDWVKDSALNRRLGARSHPRYAHLYACEFWLPHEMKDSFLGPSPAGNQARMGSVFGLLGDLNALNERTFRGSAQDLERWRAAMPNGADVAFEPKAKTGLAIMLELAAAAARERLPMVLDY